MESKTFIIAEAGVNHNGSLKIAKRLIDIAVKAGANAVKFQTFKAEKLVSRFAPKAEYQTKLTNENETQFDMIKKLELDEEEHKALFDYCLQKKIEFVSTPFDLDSVDFLANKLNVSKLKIPSGEITNAPLLLKAAHTGKPVILSTGMSTLGEVEFALGVLAFGYCKLTDKPSTASFKKALASPTGQDALNEKVSLLHCTTEYPAPFEEVNLKVIDTLKQAFGLTVGYSDHTEGIAVSIAAVARGASVIEKHFTIDKNLPGPDHKASLEPDELYNMVKSIRQVELALGTSIKLPTPAEGKNAGVARKSLVALREIKKGEVFTESNLGIKRPGTGVSPCYYWDYLGKKANRYYKMDEVIDS
jgi:N-acetylneuraminate synthase